MSDDTSTRQSLQALLSQAVDSLSNGTAIAPNESSTTDVDITEEFLNECSKMKLGELAMSENFQLCEAMSAIELMDPKMDIGMVAFDRSIRFDCLVQSGRLNVTQMDLKELLSTMDAMFASLMSWLDGNSIAQTLFTCVCLHDVKSIQDQTLSSFCYAMLSLSSSFRYIIQTAAVYEEEDFNGYFLPEIKTIPLTHLLSLLKSTENELLRKLRLDKSDLLEAILNRVSLLRFMIVALTAIVPPPSNIQDGSSIAFRPNLEDCFTSMRSACCLLEKIEATIKLGLEAPNENDGDFAWLPAFEPEVNRRFLPPTFPRKTQMLSRVEGISLLKKLATRILTITSELPNRIANIESTLCFLRWFSVSESCVLSRSLLQLVYLPNDDRIMGRTHLSDVVIDSLKLFAAPPILDPSCTLSSDSRCRSMWSEFINDSVKVFLGVIQMFGLNLARQREKIACCIEDFSALQNEAERLESEFDAFLMSQSSTPTHNPQASTSSASSPWNIQLSLTSFVLYHTLLLIDYHFFLSFKLDLFAHFEYPYVYWYMSEVVFKWLLNTIDRSHTLIIADYKRSIKDKKKTDRKRNVRSKKETELRKRISDGQRSLLFYRAQATIADAFFKVSVGLISAGKIRVPSGDADAERYRFEHRMFPFSSLSAPLILSYVQFREMSRVSALLSLGHSRCFQQAAECFELARSELDKLDSLSPSNDSLLDNHPCAISQLCKRNAVVARILSSGSRIDSVISFEFTPSSVIYPLLKIS